MRRKSTPRLPISTALIHEAAKAARRLYPGIRRLHLVGSRLRHREGRDIDFVAVTARREMAGRNATLRAGRLSVNLFFALSGDEEPAILEFGLGLDIVRWKRKAVSLGFRLNRYGLWKGKSLLTVKMAQIAGILGMPLKSHLVFSLNHPL